MREVASTLALFVLSMLRLAKELSVVEAAMLRVVKNVAKSLEVVHGHSKLH